MNAPVTELFKYRVTQFGLTVYRAARSELKYNEALIPWLQSTDGIAWLESEKHRGQADKQTQRMNGDVNRLAVARSRAQAGTTGSRAVR